MHTYIMTIGNLLPSIAILTLAIYANKRDHKIKEMEDRLKKLESKVALNEIEQQINQIEKQGERKK